MKQKLFDLKCAECYKFFRNPNENERLCPECKKIKESRNKPKQKAKSNKSIWQITRELEKYKGLLFNWYDTRSMVPLYPRYVSSVDCGNFIGYIMVLKKSLEDAVKNPVFRIKEASSLTDIIKLAGSEIDDDSCYPNERLENDYGESLASNKLYKSLLVCEGKSY